MALPHVCLPVQLDAFILNEEVCTAKGLSLVAPVTQPNYVSLRLTSNHVQHDILPNVDLHNANKGLTNPRISSSYQSSFTDANTDPEPKVADQVKVDRKRLGIYLHWSVPRAYRAGTSAAAPPPKSAGDNASPKTDTNPQPTFPSVPNRWLIIRSLHSGWLPATAKPDKVSAWVVESDRLRKVDELALDENGEPIDLETDVSPFVAYAGGNAKDDDNILNNQAENFIGYKTPLAVWREGKPRRDNQAAIVTGSKYIDLSVMNSSNPLFADYTAHNSNVFSIKDNLYYGNGQYLESATCDYIVLGWHSDYIDDPLSNDVSQDLASRLRSKFCGAPVPQTSPDAENDSRINSKLPTRLVCHAAKYNVEYSPQRPAKSPADTYAASFTQAIDMEPVSVGTTALDGMLAFFQAHSAPDDTTLPTTIGAEAAKTASDLMGIRELLYATEDDYDSRIKAADLVFAHNFSRQAGGFHWRYSKKKDPEGPPVPPSADPPKIKPDPTTASDPLALMTEVDLMLEMNNAQRTVDSASTKLSLLGWNLFSEWFKYVSDPLSGSAGNRLDIYTTRVPLLRSEATKLTKIVNDAQAYIAHIQTAFARRDAEPKKVAHDPYFKRLDPTLCLAGIDAGWDPQYLSNTPTRFIDKVGTGASIPDFSTIVNLLKDVTRFSSDKKGTLDLSNLSSSLIKLITEASAGMQTSSQVLGLKTWDGQPFAPQYIEWEGMYYHVPWSLDNWDVQLTLSAIASSNHKQVSYNNPANLSTMRGSLDQRAVSGRMLVLPQPSFALGAVVAQVLDASNNDKLPTNLHAQENKDALVAAVKNLKFISGEMAGLTDSLLTLGSGQHVKPNVREQGGKALAMKPAVTVGSKISMVPDDFVTVGSESAKTPYGTLFRFSEENNAPSPFKGIQHGQFAITKLVVVDKFGQAVSCPLPKRKLRSDGLASQSIVPDFIHPCLSEQLIPSLLPDGKTLNTVYTTVETNDHATKSGFPMTPFVQLDPSINQEARMNATFLNLTSDGNSWQPCNEWDNPIFGWVIVNYADSALQFFTADGTYYTSKQFGGPSGTITSLLWLPFNPPPAEKAKGKVSPHLIQLITKLGEVDYMKALWEIVRMAIPTMPFPPSDYAPYANAIVGKPLALVNAGWSVELAQPPLWSQHTLPAPQNPKPGEVDPLRTDAENKMGQYKFKVKIGDSERPFDGVVAYWDVPNSATSTITDFNKLYAYTSSDETKNVITVIETTNFPTLTPYYLHAEKLATPGATLGSTDTSFTKQHTAQLNIKTLLVDPYTPIHVYSGILPIKSLKLPSWAISQALKKMTAFFTLGPLLISKDVPASYDPTHPLDSDNWLTPQAQTETAGDDEDRIKLPIAGGKGMWRWLQPYIEGEGENAQTRYNALAVDQEDGKLRHEPGPYTLVEGYLSLAKPLVDIS